MAACRTALCAAVHTAVLVQSTVAYRSARIGTLLGGARRLTAYMTATGTYVGVRGVHVSVRDAAAARTTKQVRETNGRL